MQTKKTHWPSLLILIVLGLSAALMFLISAGAGISSLIGLFSDGADPAGGMIGAVAFGFELLVLLISSWFVLQKTLGREPADLPFKFPFVDWHILLVIGLAGVSVLVGGVIAYTEIAWLTWLMLPVLTVLVIVPPLLLFLGLGARGIEFGPRWRVFGILGIAMTVGPVIMIVLEVVVLVGIIALGAVVIAVRQPELMQELISISKILNQETNPDVILNLLAPYLSNAGVIAVLIGYIGLIVPLIEELLKPLGVWLFAWKIESPAQGFALGMLSGAAFALVESLNASGTGSAEWPVIVSVRAGTSLLHMMASGLVGWGIVSAFREKRYLRLPAAYFCAVAIHGLWNSCAVGAGLSAVGESIGKPEWLAAYIPSMFAGMLVLGVGMFVVLIASNRKLSGRPESAPLLSVETEEEKVQ